MFAQADRLVVSRSFERLLDQLGNSDTKRAEEFVLRLIPVEASSAGLIYPPLRAHSP
jgi:hypothetical protein